MDSTTDKKRYMDGTKLLFHMDRVIDHYDKNKRIAPIHIDVGLTKKCNIHCCFCYGYYQNMSGEIIERKALLDNLVTPAAKIGVKSLGFIGDGEPTLNPACYEALILGKKLGLSMAISTNGVLVDDDYKRASILESCEWMRFCICSVNDEGYKKIHRSGHRKKVMENIEKLIEYKIKHNLKCEIGLQMVFVPTMMLDDVIEVSQYAIDVGADYFVIKQCSLPDGGESGITQFSLSDYEKPEVKDVLKRAEAMSTDKTDIVPKWNIIALKGEKKYERCAGIQLLPEISGDGGIYPCAYFFGGNRPELCYGNVHDKSLEEIIFSDKYWEIVDHMGKKFNPKKECKGCCRQDKTNEFIWEYLHPPKGVNFI